LAERPIDEMTLREKFTYSERLVRELIEHVEQSFLPKIAHLAELVAPEEEKTERKPLADAIPIAETKTVADADIRNQSAAILSSDDFSQTLFRKLDEVLAALDQGSRKALAEAPPRQ
jgi:hypothetical protein